MALANAALIVLTIICKPAASKDSLVMLTHNILIAISWLHAHQGARGHMSAFMLQGGI